jgi:hypothetical protein
MISDHVALIVIGTCAILLFAFLSGCATVGSPCAGDFFCFN